MAIPQKPAQFHPEKAPNGVEVKFVTFLADRPFLPTKPRVQVVHTNAASGEGNVEQAWRWAHAAPGVNTCPHYTIDRSGRARKMLPTNRKALGNATVNSAEGTWGDSGWWSLVYETADLGWPNPGENNVFTPAQGETIATILAYESIVNNIPLEYSDEWYQPGSITHTEPHPYPYFTIVQGKTCPGREKKRQMREWLLPRAREIKAAWLALPTTPPPPPTPDVQWVDYGYFQLHSGMRWPAALADTIYGNWKLHEVISNFNPAPWPTTGKYVKIPSLPAAVTGRGDVKLGGALVRVKSGQAAAAIIGNAFPSATWNQKLARIPALSFWNGGRTQFVPGEVVFVSN